MGRLTNDSCLVFMARKSGAGIGADKIVFHSCKHDWEGKSRFFMLTLTDSQTQFNELFYQFWLDTNGTYYSRIAAP